jgi:hypothetical protein
MWKTSANWKFGLANGAPSSSLGRTADVEKRANVGIDIQVPRGHLLTESSNISEPLWFARLQPP